MSNVKIIKDGNEIGSRYKIEVDGANISNITTDCIVHITPCNTRIGLELMVMDNIEINLNAEVEINGIKIPDELFDKIFASIIEIARQRNRPVPPADFFNDRRSKA